MKKKLFQQPLVLEARDAYIAELKALSKETLDGVHHQYLKDTLQKLALRRAEIRKAQGDRLSGIAEIQLGHLNSEMAVISHAASDLQDFPERILNNLKSEAAKVLAAFEDPHNEMKTANGRFNHSYIGRAYADSREDTVERYKLLDIWYAIGSEFAIDQQGRHERAYRLALIPESIQRAKWRFMIALTDEAFHHHSPGAHPERLDANELTLLSHLYERLSLHERGADNATMPYTHKFRHNPAIHSLHVVTLSDKIFHDAEVELDKNQVLTPALKEKIQKMRDLVMRSALVHDCGEIDGELNQPALQEGWSDERKAAFNIARNEEEQKTFTRYLEAGRKHLDVKDGDWRKLKDTYMEAFELPEKTDTFLGRLVKTLERMQSQHDYVRFEGKSGAQMLKDTTEDNKQYSTNYVSKMYRDGEYDGILGKQALVRLAEDAQDPDEKLIFSALVKVVEPEYQHLMDKITAAYAKPPAIEYLGYWRAKGSKDEGPSSPARRLT